MSKNGSKKKPPVEKPPLFPERAELEKEIIPADKLLIKLTKIFEEKQGEYFPEKDLSQLQDHFNIFDRDQDDIINFEEMKEIMVSLNYSIKEEKLLKELFDLLEKESVINDKKGINYESLLIILCKEKSSKDLKAILLDAFKYLDLENTGVIDGKEFTDLLMYCGYKYNEDQIETFMKYADTQGTGKIQYYDFVEMISNLKPNKKKKGKKAAK